MILSHPAQLDALPLNAELAVVGMRGSYFKRYDGTFRPMFVKKSLNARELAQLRPYLVEAMVYDPADLNKLLDGAVLLSGPHVMQLRVVDTRRFWMMVSESTVYPERFLPARVLDPGTPKES